eukprot:m.49448 g.49448  ORF g.49448 m.49448 type:complete len:1080 (+) comp7121_c0_seq1:38-3277(+)
MGEMTARGKIFGAASAGDTLAVRAAITSGEDVDGVDIGRSTALHWAARKGHLGVATVLVSKGASLMKKTKLGKTAIDLAREEGNNEVFDFLSTAYEIQHGRGRKMSSATKKSSGSRSNTPLRTSGPLKGPAAVAANERMLEWATELATQHISDAEKERAAAHRKRAEEDESRNSSAQKQARQKAEIDKLLSVIKQARQSISPDKGPVRGGGATNGTEWQSAANVLEEIDAQAAGRSEDSNGHHDGPGSSTHEAEAATHSRSPASTASPATAKRDADKKKKEAKLAQERRQKLVAERQEAAKEKHEATLRKQRAAEERRKSLVAEKKASEEAERAKRLGELDRARKRALAKATRKQNTSHDTSDAGSISVVSLDTSLTGKSVGHPTPRKTSKSGTSTPSSASRSAPSSSRRRPHHKHTPITGAGAGSTTTTPTDAKSLLINPRRSGVNSTSSVLSADLEDEYLSWVKGMNDSTQKEKKLSPSKLASPRKNGSTRTVTIERQPGSGLGVGIYSSKAGQGVSVSSVLPQSPFGLAGVEVGDVFLEINGTDVSAAMHGEAVRLLKGAPDRFTIRLWSKRKDRATTPTPVRAPAPRFNHEFRTKTRLCTVVRKGDKEPLGVALFSDAQDRWVQVHMAVPGGPFDRAGLAANDVILEVNGKSMLALSHSEVVTELKNSGHNFQVKAAALDDVLAAQLPSQPTAEGDMMQSTAFTIHRIPDEGLGIAICSDKGNTGIRIRNVTPNGPFGKAGVPKDSVIVRLDDVVLLDATHADVVEALRKAGDVFQITVATDREVEDYTKRRAGGRVSALTSPISRRESTASTKKALAPKRLDVKRRPNQGLGVALCSNKRRLGVRISQLDPRGPLAAAGVKEQDVIVQVNGFPCLKASHDEVVQAFRRAPDNFAVVVVSGDDFDEVTPEYARSPSTGAPSADPIDEMRPNALIHTRVSTSAGRASRSSKFYMTDHHTQGADDMRSEPTHMDPRISDALLNTEGYSALKRAQEQAMSLKASTDMYEDVFGRPDGRKRSNSGGAGSPSGGTSARPRESSSLNKTYDEEILRVMKQELEPRPGVQRVRVHGRTTARV